MLKENEPGMKTFFVKYEHTVTYRLCQQVFYTKDVPRVGSTSPPSQKKKKLTRKSNKNLAETSHA